MNDVCNLASVSAVILAGGASSRMSGNDKALLCYQGESFLVRLTKELSCCGEVLVSVDRHNRYPNSPVKEIVDARRNCGPLSGVCTVLQKCRFPLLLTVPCDLPRYKISLASRLLQAYTPDVDAVAIRDYFNTIHPLCALYARSALPLLQEQLESGSYRMRDALEVIKTTFIVADYHEMKMLQNINTPEDFQFLMGNGQGKIEMETFGKCE